MLNSKGNIVPLGTIKKKQYTFRTVYGKNKEEITWDIYLEILNSVKFSVFGN